MRIIHMRTYHVYRRRRYIDWIKVIAFVLLVIFLVSTVRHSMGA